MVEFETDGATMEMKAKDIAEELGPHRTYVGRILGRWRHADDPPFAITAAELTGSGNLWMIEHTTGFDRSHSHGIDLCEHYHYDGEKT